MSEENQIMELDAVSVNMLVTPDMFPLPEEAMIEKNLGEDYIILTDEEGNTKEVVEGQHLILVFEASDFVDWIKDRVFYLFNSAEEIFQPTKISRVS